MASILRPSIAVHRALAMVRAIGIGLMLWATVNGSVVQAAPQRIVSLHLCTDQLLLTLAPRERIAALSHLATRPDLSTLWQKAQGIPQVHGSAEEVLALSPDLVLAPTMRKRHTVMLLKQFGIPVLTLAPAEDFATVQQHIQRVAKALGKERRGETVLAALGRELQQLKATAPRTGAFYWQGGYVPGSGTLVDAVMQAANMVNVAVAAGVRGSGYLPLERLLIERPEWLITSDYKRDVPTLGSRLLRHPALRGATSRAFILPSNLTTCGGVWNAEAARLLAALPPVR